MATTMFRTFLSAAKTYQTSSTDKNREEVLKQFDVLMGATSSATDLQFFNPRDLLVAESLIKMVDLLLDMNPEIVQKLFFLLGNLGNCPRLQESLCLQLHLHSSLAVFLQSYGATDKDTLVIQCLKLLDVYTYHAVLPAVENPIVYLLDFIFKEIQLSFSECLVPCLGILSNLCLNSRAVVSYIKSLPNFKRKLMDLLEKVSSTQQTVLLHSMIVLHTLSKGDHFGRCVFHERNLIQAIEVVIHVCNTDELSTHRAATNLLSALLTTPEYQAHISRSNQLDNALTTIWKALASTKSPFFACNLQHLLVSMFSVPDIRLQALNALLCSTEEGAGPILSNLADWTKNSDNNVFIHKVDILSWKLITDIVRELLKQGMVSEYMKFIEMTLEEALIQCLTAFQFDSPDLHLQLEKVAIILGFVYLLNQFEETRPILKVAKPEWFKTVVSNQTNNYSEIVDQDMIKSSLRIVLLAVTIAGDMVPSFAQMKTTYEDILKDKNIMPFFAAGLNSTDQEQVKGVLNALIMASQLFEFPTDLLGDAVSTNNRLKAEIRSREQDGCVKIANKLSMTPTRRQSMDNSIELLISKLESGLEIRDLDCSDIMEMYENKVHLLLHQMQEDQKVIEVKTSALQQTDKMLSHYRCLQAQHEAEVLRLRTLIKESERKSEESKELSKKMAEEKGALQNELTASKETITSLQTECEELSECKMEASHRLKAIQQQIEEYRVNTENLQEMNTVLQKHNKNFQQKQDALLEDVKNLANEKMTLTKQLKDKETKVKELGATLKKCTEDLQKKDQSLVAAKKTIENFKEKQSDFEKKNSDLTLEVSSLHKLCTQHQHALLEKDQEIKIANEKYLEQKKLTEQIVALCQKR